LADKETSDVASLYRDTEVFPEPMKSVLQRELREYTRFIIEKRGRNSERESFQQAERKPLSRTT
jgi:hypothetical protein